MSREYEIDMELRRLFGKMVKGEATREERDRLQDLQRERVKRMTPVFHSFNRD